VRRILLLGRNGQLGWELQRALAPLGELIALDRSGARSAAVAANGPFVGLCADFERPEELAVTMRAVRPQIIVNAAAYTAVDRAESEPETARAINARAPGVLAEASAELGACLIHYSSDYVFDGSGSRPWNEDDLTGPLGVYGLTKLEGERRIRQSGCRHLILRTSWVYATRGSNFPKAMLRLAAERVTLKVVDDQVGAPTGAELLADATAHALKAVAAEPGLAGTYHLTASGETSLLDYARFVIEGARARGGNMKLAPGGLVGVPSSGYPTVARRPLNSRLDCSRFERAFGLRMPHWTQGVERLLDEIAQVPKRGGQTSEERESSSRVEAGRG
jgi:dTDP-4-dehydrorhamnose reductase